MRTMSAMPPRRKGMRVLLSFLAVFLIVAAVIGVLAAVEGRRRQYRQLSDYEFLREEIASADASYFYQLAAPFWENALTIYEDADAVRAAMRALLSPDRITVARADGYTEEEPVYTLYADEKEVFTAMLVFLPRSGWKLRSLTLSERCALGREIVIEAPHGAAVTLNGIALNPADAVTVLDRALSALEADLSEEYTADRYTPGLLFLSPETSAVLKGYPLSLDTVEDGCLRYGYPSSLLLSRTITVPFGAVVKVNGTELTARYLLESGGKYPFLTRFEENKLNLVSSVYQVSGLFREPTVEVTLNGTVLLPDGNSLTYRMPDSLCRSITVSAPSYATVKLNGVSLGRSEAVSTRTAPIFEGLSGYEDSRVTMVRYTVSGLLSDPILTAADANGRPLTLQPFDSSEEEPVFSFGASPDPIPDAELLTARTFAKLYITYVYSGSSGITVHYNNAAEMTPSSSPAFAALRAAYRKVAALPVHTKITVKSPTVLSYTVHSETVYSVILRVPFTAKSGGKTVSREVSMEILCAYSGKIRRILNYRVLADTLSDA